MKKIFIILLISFPIVISAQNVGIGNPTPNEKLDVNGNINVTGTIKANGTDGTAGQVLMKNSSGSLVWGDMCEYKNIATFTSGTSISWPIPVGTKSFWVEIWGGGGCGNIYAGGGGGAYISALINVVDPLAPGSLTYTVGLGGTGGSGANGTLSSLSYTNPVGLLLQAGGGFGVTFTAGSPATVGNGFGGSVSIAPASFTSYISERGQVGLPHANTIHTTPSATYEVVTGGKGGNAGSTTNTGGGSNQLIYNLTTSTSLQITNALANGHAPGGGGGSGLRLLNGITSLVGSNAGNGLIIIHY
jgi:hypothetical protein